jgi:hypothetical protein
MPPTRHKLGPAGRIIAILLAVVWLSAGIISIVLFGLYNNWVIPILGILSIIYGVIWIQVARTGRRIQWPFRRR